jgi:hypothetical protein
MQYIEVVSSSSVKELDLARHRKVPRAIFLPKLREQHKVTCWSVFYYETKETVTRS